MSDFTLRVLRGNRASLPSLNSGEFYLATDDKTLHIGGAISNQLIAARAATQGEAETGTDDEFRMTALKVKNAIDFSPVMDNSMADAYHRHSELVASDGTPDPALTVAADGKIGVGDSAPDGLLHLYSGSAGAVTAGAGADDLIVENSGDVGMSLISPDVNKATIAFGSASDAKGAALSWDYTTSALILATSKTGAGIIFQTDNEDEAMRIDNGGLVGINTTTPDSELDVTHARGTYGTAGIISQRTTGADTVAFGLYNTTQKWDLVNIVSTTPDYFGIHDVTGVKTPFKVDAGSLDNMLVVANNRVGIATNSPDTILHAKASGAEIRVEGTSSTGTLAARAPSGQDTYLRLDEGTSSRFYLFNDASADAIKFQAINSVMADRMYFAEGEDNIRGDGLFLDNNFGPSEWVILEDYAADPGDVVVADKVEVDVDGAQRLRVKRCDTQGDRNVQGIVVAGTAHHGNPNSEELAKLTEIGKDIYDVNAKDGHPGARIWAETHQALELTGYQKVKVVGSVQKGDFLITSTTLGAAKGVLTADAGTILGKSLEDITLGENEIGYVFARIHLM